MAVQAEFLQLVDKVVVQAVLEPLPLLWAEVHSKPVSLVSVKKEAPQAASLQQVAKVVKVASVHLLSI